MVGVVFIQLLKKLDAFTLSMMPAPEQGELCLEPGGANFVCLFCLQIPVPFFISFPEIVCMLATVLAMYWLQFDIQKIIYEAQERLSILPKITQQCQDMNLSYLVPESALNISIFKLVVTVVANYL